ncbi:uncharacterized protein EV154DRAFT_488960 [Mucor mucedo]|uniref:uncharacterized protein n=1 Tax=Mucor mucedo TaxID=29922 RepID=UPI00221F9744|nr:uncharacterized protein EV154DRAFT_488960 [Mucor mucedo]KAI7864154.1 hypothetical protein EV154DRAFT_488960 [Mucor mucedo]
MEITVLNDADPVGFMDCRTRGERVFRVFQLLGMAGILALEVMTAKAYSRYHRSFEEQLEMLMKHLLPVLMRGLSLPAVSWIYQNIQQKPVVLNQILSKIDVAEFPSVIRQNPISLRTLVRYPSKSVDFRVLRSVIPENPLTLRYSGPLSVVMR